MWEFEAIGTHWRIDLAQQDVETHIKLRETITARIEEFDKNYSRFRTDSLVHRMSQTSGKYDLPDDAKKMLDMYQDLYVATDGAVTPLIGQMLVDAGYDATYSLKSSALSVPSSWDDVLEYSFPMLSLKQPALLDFGAVGKGYLVDIVAEIIDQQGIQDYIIDAGGDIRIKSKELRQIGLEHPNDQSKVIGIASIQEGSICGSSGNRRAWGNFHHIFNPEMRESVKDVLAVWVTSPEARIADGLSTALFFTAPDVLRKRLADKYSFEFLVVYPDYSVARSSGFPGELFLNDGTL